MTARLYILSGASGCGKTWLLNSVAAVDQSAIDSELRAFRAPKFSERKARKRAGGIDDVTELSPIYLGTVDIAYVMNNVKYGIKLAPMRQLLDQGLNLFIILSDFRVVRELKRVFGNQAVALYISSAIDPDRLRRIQNERLGFQPTEEQKGILAYHFARTNAAARLNWWDRVSECMTDLEMDWRAYATDAKSTEIRAQRIRAFHIRYIEHLPMFDHVILNYSEGKPQEMTAQITALIKNSDLFAEYKRKKCAPIFIMAAASGAGKGTLMEMLHLIGRDKVRITSKLAKRVSRPEDKRDGMIALKGDGTGDSSLEWPSWWTPVMKDYGKREEFPPEYDMRWEFHKAGGGNSKGVPYAVSSAEIQRNVDEGMPQIVVSNMDQFAAFRSRWPSNVVFVYLHRLVSDHENREFQTGKWKDHPSEAEVRIAEKQSVHESYIERISEFDHVLLNTGFQEDLYDQMFRLLEFYRGGLRDQSQSESDLIPSAAP